jgi:hypothetical protein
MNWTGKLWADANQRLDGAACAAAGIRGVARYVGVGSAGKRLTQAELDDLRAHGITVVGVVESTADRSNLGATAGTQDAQATLADPVTATLPYLFLSNDQNINGTMNLAYARAFQAVIGRARTGVYGFSDFLTACHTAGIGTVYWQAGHPPSTTGTGGFVQLWQRQGTAGDASDGPASPTGITLGLVLADLDNLRLELNTMTSALTGDQQTEEYNQTVNPFPSKRYPTPAAGNPAFTLVDYSREVDREINSKLSAAARALPAARPDTDTLFGHAVSTHEVAEQILASVVALQASVDKLATAIAGIAEPTVSGTFSISGSGTVS